MRKQKEDEWVSIGTGIIYWNRSQSSIVKVATAFENSSASMSCSRADVSSVEFAAMGTLNVMTRSTFLIGSSRQTAMWIRTWCGGS